MREQVGDDQVGHRAARLLRAAADMRRQHHVVERQQRLRHVRLVGEDVALANVTRIIEVTLEAKIFGVGGLIESSFEKQMREESDRSATFTHKWLQSGGLT